MPSASQYKPHGLLAIVDVSRTRTPMNSPSRAPWWAQRIRLRDLNKVPSDL